MNWLWWVFFRYYSNIGWGQIHHVARSVCLLLLRYTYIFLKYITKPVQNSDSDGVTFAGISIQAKTGNNSPVFFRGGLIWTPLNGTCCLHDVLPKRVLLHSSCIQYRIIMRWEIRCFTISLQPADKVQAELPLTAAACIIQSLLLS